MMGCRRWLVAAAAAVLVAHRASATSKRRVAIELVLGKARHYLAIEEGLEREERWALASKLARARPCEPTTVAVRIPERNFTYAVPDHRGLQTLSATNGTFADDARGNRVAPRLSLRGYFRRTEKAAASLAAAKEAFASPRRPNRDRARRSVFGGESDETRVNWGTGGYVALGRCLGCAVVPVRVAFEIAGRLVLRPAASASEAFRAPLLARLLRFADGVLAVGPVKALGDLDARLDPRLGRTAFYYNHALRRTGPLRAVARVAWKTPADAFRYGRRAYYAAVLGHKTAGLPAFLAPRDWPAHERLEAALLRAAIDESVAYLARLGPPAAARRKRRLAARALRDEV